MSTTPGHFNIQIPTKPYLAKYITRKYGDPIVLNNKTLFGTLIFTLLQKDVCVHLDLSEKHVRFRSFTHTLLCYANWRYASAFGVDLTDDHVIQLNRVFETEFEENLHNYVQMSIKEDCRRKGYDIALHSFVEKHGIVLEQDITYECLKKMEYRFRKKKENILSGFVPSQFQRRGDRPAA